MVQLEGDRHVVRAVNAAFCRLLGQSERELIGKPFEELVPLGAECITLVDNVYRTGVARSHVRARADERDPVYWSYTCLPVAGMGDAPLGVLVQVTETAVVTNLNTAMNEALLISSVRQHELATNAEQLNVELKLEIAEHEAAEELLRKNRDTFFGLIEKAPFGLFIVDAQFRLQHVSSGAGHVFAHVPHHIGHDFATVLSVIWQEPFVRKVIDGFRHTLATGDPFAEKELTEQRKDTGELESYDWRTERIILPDGQFGVVCYFYDITEHAKSRELLRVADRRKSEFLATLAHELRNPLAPLRNGLDLLAVSQGDEATWGKAHGMMERQLDQMVRLIDELLDLSRITRGTVHLQRLRVDMLVVLQQALEMSHPMIEQHAHQLLLDIAPRPLFVNGDAMRLTQVFNNLLNNAAKYTDRGGVISLKVTTSAGEVTVKVADNGIGIAREDLARVFDMFAQIPGALDRSQGGLGIGLNIVKHLVEMHGGRIAVSSDGPGKGSCFTVHLPLAAAVGPLPVTIRAEPATPAPRRILVVDDNADAATMMALLLRKMGHEVHTAADGAEAVDLAATLQPDVVLMDLGMPVMDGHAACIHMRRTAAGKDMFIVALTGWGQEEDKLRSKRSGFDHHLVKPVSSDALKAVVALARTKPNEH